MKALKEPYDEAHVVRNWGHLPTATCQQPCEWAILETGPQAPAEPPDDCSPGLHLDCNLMRDYEPELPNQAMPKFLTHRNNNSNKKAEFLEDLKHKIGKLELLGYVELYNPNQRAHILF